MRDLARAHTVTALETLVKISMTGKSESARIAAVAALLDRGWGKPTQPLANDAENPLVPPLPVLNVTISRVDAGDSLTEQP